VVVVAITSNVRLGEAPGNVVLSKKASGLTETSVANVSQLLTLDKSMLNTRISALPAELLRKLDAGLRLVLEL
jgi:mRNA interferase MazF